MQLTTHRHPADYRDQLEHAEVAPILSGLPEEHPARLAYASAREAADSVSLSWLVADRAENGAGGGSCQHRCMPPHAHPARRTLQAVTLVLQIALGIVLAVVILVYWREIVALGVSLVVLAVVLLGLGIGVAALSENKEHLGVWVAAVAFFTIIAWAANRLFENGRKQEDAGPPSEQRERDKEGPER